VQRIIDRDITEQELWRHGQTGLLRNPFILLQGRKKELSTKHQADLIKEVREYANTLKELNHLALQADGPDEHELFTKQYKFLPSYSRRKVMYGYPLIAGNKQ
jgi:hypothetical protein